MRYYKAPSCQRTRTTLPEGQTSSLPSQTVETATVAGAIGALAGLMGSLAGMGGGFVMIPLMTTRRLPLRLTQHEAHGTSLFAVAATGFAGALSYGIVPGREKRNTNDNETSTTTSASTAAAAFTGTSFTATALSNTGVVRIPEAIAVAIPAILTARWGAQATLHMSGQVLRRALGCLMLVVAPMIPAKVYYLQYLEELAKTPSTMAAGDATVIPRPNVDAHHHESFSYRSYLAPAMIGVGSGYLSGLFGVGGGTIVVPALTLCTDLTHHEALATSLTAMILPAVSGTLSHYRAGNCVMRVAPYLAVGAMLGASMGAQLSLATNEETLRWGFSILLVILGLRALLKA